MQDAKNIFIASASSLTSLFTALEARTIISIVSAVILPIILFSIGKAVDVALQVYFKRKEEERKER